MAIQTELSKVTDWRRVFNPVDPVRHATLRGLLVSIILSLFGSVSELSLRAANLSSDSIFVYHDIVLFGLLGFVGDVAFAEEKGFRIWSKRHDPIGAETNLVPHILSSLGSQRALKVVISIVTDMMIILPIFLAFKRRYPDLDPLVDKLVKVGLWTALFLSYNNILRFEWVYKESVSVSTDLVVGLFSVITALIFFFVSTPEEGEPGHGLMTGRFQWVAFWTLFVSLSAYNLTKSFTQGPLYKWYRGQRWPQRMIGGLVAYAVVSTFVWGLAQPSAQEEGEPATTESPYVSLALAGLGTLLAAWFLFTTRYG